MIQTHLFNRPMLLLSWYFLVKHIFKEFSTSSSYFLYLPLFPAFSDWKRVKGVFIFLSKILNQVLVWIRDTESFPTKIIFGMDTIFLNFETKLTSKDINLNKINVDSNNLLERLMVVPGRSLPRNDNHVIIWLNKVSLQSNLSFNSCHFPGY